ncbi:MAG: type II toxin-antitoxin system HicA family toxin [Candidatus Riflebacteria bacterium]|nr:type II toxin-antitoxin system HicA family toxin [Candidatus Riflebacteria bacterium]
MKIKEFIRRLKRAGVTFVAHRSGSSHHMAYRGQRKTPVPVHEGQDYDDQFLREICKHLGLDPREIVP